MILVLNEWIFHDLWGENGAAKQSETMQFLDVFRYTDDILAVPNNLCWRRKVHRLMTMTDVHIVSASKLLRSLILNSDKAIVQVTTPEIPEALLGQLPKEDVYLVSAYLSSGAGLLVTTDRGLFDSLADTELVSCQMRDDFLSSYLS